MQQFNSIGKSFDRVDAVGKVTGSTKYASDLEFPGMHYGGIIYSEYPHAVVKRINKEHAETIDGVKSIITAEDIPGTNLFGYDVHHRPILVGENEETRFVGDAIALIIAENQEIVYEAKKCIKVDYEPLSPLTTIVNSLGKEAHLIHKSNDKSAYKSTPDAEGNVCYQTQMIHGNIEEAFNQCNIVVEDVYSTSRQEHAFLETEAGIAYVDDDGVLHILSAIQDPYVLLEDIAYGLGISKSKIHIKGMTAGGAFGGKLHNTIQVHLAVMAYLTKIPVKIVLNRYESFFAHPKRHSQEIRIKVGAGSDGNIEAIEAYVLADAGPYSSRTPEVLGLTVSSILGPYSIPNVQVVGKAVYTNNADADAFRGFGAPQAAVAREGILDKLARALKMGPLELRKKNFLRPGEKTVAPLRGDSPVSLETLAEKVQNEMGPLPQPKERSKTRIGRSICFDMPVFDVAAIPVLGKSGVGTAMELFSDGSAIVYAGGCELGQGVTTILAQVACEELGINIENIQVEMTDTWTCPPSGRTSASRLTYVLGNSLKSAAQKIKNTLFEKAAGILETDKSLLIYNNDKIYVHDNKNKSISIIKLASICYNEGIQLREEGWFKYPEPRLMYGHTFMASAADVSVDLETGSVKVLKLLNVHDSGKVINPVLARGQQLGGSLQALGFILMEDFIVEEGRVKTTSLSEYTIPTSLDVPDEFEAESIETPYPSGPYGAKGLAEHSLNTTGPAILNGISNAIGKSITNIPVYPEHILRKIKE